MFLVRQEDVGENVHTDVLEVGPLIKHPGYQLSQDDPDIYSDDEDFIEGVTLRREWPDQALPQKKKIPEVSDERAVLIKKTLEAHHFNARLLESMGVNACKQYKLSKAEDVLHRVGKDDSTCRICGRKGFCTPHTLRSHIQAVHMKKTKHQCSICSKYFAEKWGLKAHRHLHTNEKFLCDKCDKSYDSVGYLNEHKKSHLTAKKRGSLCRSCGNSYAHRRGYLAHLEFCGVPLEERCRYECEECGKSYAHKRDLT